MANTETNNETGKVRTSVQLDPVVFGAVSDLAIQEDRSVSNMVERLLKQSPQLAEKLEAEPA